MARHMRTRATNNHLIFLIILFLFVPLANADVSEVAVSPNSPEQGDVVTLSIKAQPGETVEVSVSFTKTVAVLDGRYEYRLDDALIPATPNKFSVRAQGVEKLFVSVRIIIWITKGATATNGVATVSQNNVPKGTHDIRIHGEAASGARAPS